MTRAEDSYPAALRRRLGLSAPPLLFGAGQRDGFDARSVAIVGSRDASESALEFAEALARRLAREGTPVVSGAARGIDRAAMNSAIDAGGVALGVVADSLLRQTKQVDTRELLQEGQLTLVTPYGPDVRFTPGNAMGRNKLIYCLADAAVVAATSVETGGTWAGAVEDLRRDWVPLWSWTDADAPPGNEALVAAGARRLLSGHVPDEGVAEWLVAPDPAMGAATEARPTRSHDLFEVVWPVLAEFLADPRSEQEVAEQFGLQLTQARAWLLRAVEAEHVKRHVRPIRYALSTPGSQKPQPSLFDPA